MFGKDYCIHFKTVIGNPVYTFSSGDICNDSNTIHLKVNSRDSKKKEFTKQK